MTGTVIPFPFEHHIVGTLGGCPRCGRLDGYVERDDDVWVYCHPHQTRWAVSPTLVYGWLPRDIDEERAYAILVPYDEVDPLPTGTLLGPPVGPLQ